MGSARPSSPTTSTAAAAELHRLEVTSPRSERPPAPVMGLSASTSTPYMTCISWDRLLEKVQGGVGFAAADLDGAEDQVGGRDQAQVFPGGGGGDAAAGGAGDHTGADQKWFADLL